MTGFSIALFLHLLFLLLATAATSLATFAGLRLRAAGTVAEITQWQSLVDSVVPAFPVAVLGLLATGIYMTQSFGAWSAPWIWASLAGLGLIALLGAGIEGSRGRALKREVARSGMSRRTRRLLRDPIAWSAKLMTLTLMGAIVFVMTTRPAAADAIASLVVAMLLGIVAAIPFWHERGVGQGNLRAEQAER